MHVSLTLYMSSRHKTICSVFPCFDMPDFSVMDEKVDLGDLFTVDLHQFPTQAYYSMFQDFPAYRDTQEGSVFIQAICRVFPEHGHKKDEGGSSKLPVESHSDKGS